jgi:hypothetical protein
VAGSSTPAPGPNALPFGTPGATDVAQALRFGASPLVRATALPAPAAAGAEKRRKVMHDKTNTPRIMPAPAECPAPRIRGKARSRTNAQSVGAGQRLGPNLEKLSDAAECFAVEGTVTGELGRQHWAVGVAVGVIGGRVPPGSRGGRVSAEDKKAAAEAPIEMFVLAHDSGKQAGKQAGPGGVSEHYLGRCLEKIANQTKKCRLKMGSSDRPRSTPRWLLCRGRRDARRCIRLTLSRRRRVPPLTRALRRTSTTPLPCASMTQPSKRCLPSSREAALWPWVGEWGGGDLWMVICHEGAGVRGRRDARRCIRSTLARRRRVPPRESGGEAICGGYMS